MTDHELAVQVRMDAEEVVNGLNDLNNALSNLPGSVEVDITTEDTVTPILETIQDSLETLPSDVEITISAFDDFATETITNIKDLVDGLPSEVNVTLTAEDNASDVLDSLKERLSDEFNITLNVDDNATEPITNLKELLSELPSTVDISLNVDDNATEIVERLQGLLGDIPDEVTTTLNADVNEENIENFKEKLEEIDGTTYDTTITVDTESMETAAETTNTFTGAVDGLTSKVAGLTAGFFSYNKTLELLNYNKIIEQSAILTNATQSQREAMEDLIRENYVYSLGMKGTASVMYTLAAYTNDVNLTMGYFKAALLGVKRSGEDASTVTLALARVFRDFNVSVQDSTDTVNLLLGLWRVSGYPSFTQFIDTVDRLGYFFKQAGLNVEDTARIIASVGPIGTRILRPFARDLAEISSSWVEGGESVKKYSDKLEGFGVAVRDAHGNLRPFKDVLFDFIEVLSQIPDQQERVRVATEVFGESVGPALAQVASNWKTTSKVTEEESERMNKALGKSAKEHRDILGWIRYYLDQFAMWLNDFFGDMGLIGESLLVGVFAKAAEYLAEGLKRLIPRVTGAIRRLLSDGFDELKGRLPEELSRRLIDTLSEGFDKAAGKAKDIIKGFIDTIKRILGDETGRLTPKIEIPAEFKFKLPKIDLTIGDTQIDDAARTLLERFTGSVDDAARVSIPELGSRIGSLLIRGIGEGVGVALLSVDILANFREYLNRALSDPTSLFGPTPLSLLPDSIKNMFSPEKLFEGIYGPEKWSKLKEALMQNIKTYIEDPIREELSKLFRDPGKYIIEGFGQVWNDFKVWVMTRIPTFKWPQLPKLPLPNPVTALQEMWNKFTGWVKEHIPTFKWPRLPSLSIPNPVTAIQSAWAKFTSWVSSNIPRFRWPRLPNITIPNIVGAIQSAWAKFRSWVSSNIPRFRWPRLPNVSMPDILGAFRRAWSTFTSKVKSSFSGFKWPRLPLPNFSGIASKFREWGASFIRNLTQGILSQIPGLQKALAIIRKYLPRSPPREGPLKDLTDEVMYGYGYSLGGSFNAGLKDSSGLLFGGFTLPSRLEGTPPAESTPQMTVKNEVRIENINGVEDKETAREVGRTIGESILETVNNGLQTQMYLKGGTSLMRRI